MSHIVTIQTKVQDPAAIASACQRLGLAEPVHGSVELYSDKVTGLIVNLPGWQYPVVIDTPTGAVQYDNFNGCWGEQAQLDRFLQMYAVEKVKLEASKKGFRVTEQPLQGGEIKLQVIEGF